MEFLPRVQGRSKLSDTRCSSLMFAMLLAISMILLTLQNGFLPVLVQVTNVRSSTERLRNFTFEQYFNGMNGLTEVYRSSIYPFTADIQAAILRHQNPEHCANADFLLFRLYNNGLGSDYIEASTALALAIYTNRVLILSQKERGWVHASECATETPECFFLPVSKCTLSQVMALVESGKAEHRIQTPKEVIVKSVKQGEVQVLETNRGKPYLAPFRTALHELMPQVLKNLGLPESIVHNHIFNSTSTYMMQRAWLTQASLYLMRLNKKTQEVIRKALKECAQGAESYREHRNAAERLIRGTVGLPLRGSDKCYVKYDRDRKTKSEMNCIPVENIVESVLRVVAAQPWLSAALITSEDPNFAEAAKHELQTLNFGVLENSFDVQQGSGRPTVKVRNGTDHVPRYLVTQSMLSTLTCQVMPMYHVITIRSNFHSLIDMLAKVVPGKYSHMSYAVGDKTPYGIESVFPKERIDD